jgi:parvulin-like peptidyl-prolyl isomerase
MPDEEKIHPARVHAAQIVVSTEPEGIEILRSLKMGKDFAELARTRSTAPEAPDGGDLGWFEAGIRLQIFDEVCFALEPGQISDLVASRYGFHIFKVLGRDGRRLMTFEEARPKLERELQVERSRRAQSELSRSLREHVRIIRDEPAIAAVK